MKRVKGLDTLIDIPHFFAHIPENRYYFYLAIIGSPFFSIFQGSRIGMWRSQTKVDWSNEYLELRFSLPGHKVNKTFYILW